MMETTIDCDVSLLRALDGILNFLSDDATNSKALSLCSQTTSRLTALLQNRTHILPHEALLDRCLEISLSIVQHAQGPSKAVLHDVVMLALKRSVVRLFVCVELKSTHFCLFFR